MLEWLLRGRRTDLVPPSEVEPPDDPLLAAHASARSVAFDAIAWYDRANRDKRNYAFLLRGAALVLGTTAAATPVLLQIAKAHWPATGLDALDTLPTVMLTLAGGFIAFDRFGDYSAGWVRYTTARTKLASALNTFDLAWLRLLRPAGEPPTRDDRLAAFVLAADLVAAVNAVIEAETDAWATAFQAELQAAQEDLKRSEAQEDLNRAAAATGAIQVTLSEPLPGPWTVSIDGKISTHRGRTAAITGLSPGLHALHLQGKDAAGEEVHAEMAVTAESNGVAQVKIDLS